jgi:hypothetical protein
MSAEEVNLILLTRSQLIHVIGMNVGPLFVTSFVKVNSCQKVIAALVMISTFQGLVVNLLFLEMRCHVPVIPGPA